MTAVSRRTGTPSAGIQLSGPKSTLAVMNLSSPRRRNSCAFFPPPGSPRWFNGFLRYSGGGNVGDATRRTGRSFLPERTSAARRTRSTSAAGLGRLWIATCTLVAASREVPPGRRHLRVGPLVSFCAPANILYCNARESSGLRPACCGVTPWLNLLSISSPESLSNGRHFRRDVRPRQARGFRPSRRK